MPNTFFRPRTVATLQASTRAVYFNQRLYILLAVKSLLSSASAEFLDRYQPAPVNCCLVYQFVLAFLLVLMFILSLCSWPIFTTWNFWFWISECIILLWNVRKVILKKILLVNFHFCFLVFAHFLLRFTNSLTTSCFCNGCRIQSGFCYIWQLFSMFPLYSSIFFPAHCPWWLAIFPIDLPWVRFLSSE